MKIVTFHFRSLLVLLIAVSFPCYSFNVAQYSPIKVVTSSSSIYTSTRRWSTKISNTNIHKVILLSSSTQLGMVDDATRTNNKDVVVDDTLKGVVELPDLTSKQVVATSSSTIEKIAAPFLSQGEIDPETLNPDLSDPKQARVIIYILISLLPVLFLIPFMLGSRELIPLDALPPVEL